MFFQWKNCSGAAVLRNGLGRADVETLTCLLSFPGYAIYPSIGTLFNQVLSNAQERYTALLPQTNTAILPHKYYLGVTDAELQSFEGTESS
jgi:hypothetical protein